MFLKNTINSITPSSSLRGLIFLLFDHKPIRIFGLQGFSYSMEPMSPLFSYARTKSPYQPLAEKLRPNELSQVIGQDHLLRKDQILNTMFTTKIISSLVLWGPPGCGKTTLARLLVRLCDYPNHFVSAVQSGSSELKAYFEEASTGIHAKPLVLIVDEIHRFNRAQQDLFLPYLESGSVIIIGTTTENPSFALNSALLSRAHVVALKPLEHEELAALIDRAEEELGRPLPLEPDARSTLPTLADGDGRYVVSLCERLSLLPSEPKLAQAELLDYCQKRAPRYDAKGEHHYNLISVLHKSLRGSDVDAALYWFCRMIEGGEDPLYIARRLIRFASEDVGLADPQALPQTIAAKEAYETLGSPEGELCLAQAIVYLATAPKSNACYVAYNQARKTSKDTGSLPPPMFSLNAPTKAMKEWGYGEGYNYDHDTPHGFAGVSYFPKDMDRQNYYNPVERGFERELKKRLEFFEKWRKKEDKP